jgi:putative ABC transport system ATP-binding protein
LLNLLGGLDRPDKGNIVIDHVDITKLTGNALIDFRLRHIGFVFQSFNLIPVLTARENVELIMQLQHRKKTEINYRVRTLFEQIGLKDKMDTRPAQLSGGQQQRVAVARALASKPQFILADEPTANLDSKSAANLLDIMSKLNKEEEITFIFSTHDVRVIERARRVITLVDGQIHSDTAEVSTSVPHPEIQTRL